MKKLFLLLSLALSLIPGAAFAINDNSSSYDYACSSNYNCTCTTGTINTQFPDIVQTESCQEACANWETQLPAQGEILTYEHTCLNSFKVRVPISAGQVESNLQRIKENPEALRKPIFPCLNVPIPGLNIGENCEWEGVTLRRNPESGVIETNILGEYIKVVYQYTLGAATIVALTFLMIGGVQYAISRGDAGMLSKGKERIKNAITGIILLLLAYNIAFLIDPSTVIFQPLSVRYVAGVEMFPPDGEDLGLRPNSSLTGIGEPIQNEPHITNYAGADAFLDSAALDALRAAAQEYYQSTGNQQTLVLTSANRNLTKQATLFYNNCLATASKRCVVPTCNPAAGSSIISSTQPYVLQGSLAGVEDPSTIVTELVKNGKYGNCPHTSLIAVDVWGDASQGEGWVHDPALQQKVITAMINNGFCRLHSEPWHFELQSKNPVSTSCSQAHNTIQYKSSQGIKTPPSTCAAWNFKTHECVSYR